MKLLHVILYIFLFLTVSVNSKADDIIISVLSKYSEPKNSVSRIVYNESRYELHHSFHPWNSTEYNMAGIVWAMDEEFSRIDTLYRKTNYARKTYSNSEIVKTINFGSDNISKTDRDEIENFIFEKLRYSPISMLHIFDTKQILPEIQGDQIVYGTMYHDKLVSVYISSKDTTVTSIEVLEHHDTFGDTKSVYKYYDNKTLGSIIYPSKVDISKINGKLKDEVRISDYSVYNAAENLFNNPIADDMHADMRTIEPDSVINILYKGYNDWIGFIHLENSDSRVLVAEFDNFLVVADSPLKSEYGEAILDTISNMYPSKPVKYFTFSHYHPHYLSGVRAFVQSNAVILCSPNNESYVNYIIEGTRSIKPDRLSNDPKVVITDIIRDSISFGNDNKRMVIYHIGEKSNHTNDYLVYYFPYEGILIQGDLTWMKKGEMKDSPSESEAGLYKAITDLGINVEAIYQSWPIEEFGIQTEIDWNDFEALNKRK
jgi:hypothetical protein